MKGIKFICVLSTVSLLFTACSVGGPSVAQTVPAGTAIQDNPTVAEFDVLEKDIADYWISEGIVPEEVSEEEVDALEERIYSLPVQAVDIEFKGQGLPDTSGIDPNTLLVPVVMVSPEAVRGLAQSVPLLQNEAIEPWLTLFHWTNHMEREAGISPYQLGKAGHFVWTIVKGAMQDNGLIMYRAATKTAGEAYMFVSKIGGRWWTALIAPNGAPVTSYDAKASLDNYSGRMLAQGFQKIAPGEVATKVRTAWENTPPTLRFWWWSLSYYVGTLSAKAAAFLTWMGGTLITFPIFIVPADYLEQMLNPTVIG